MTYFRATVIRRSLGAVRHCLSRAALAAAVAVPAHLPSTLNAQTPVSQPGSLSAEIEAKLKQRGTLILRDATLIETLFAIKENWEINIVVDNDVKGAINGAYTNAPLHEILDSILLPHGYGYRAVGDSLVVLKLNDLGALKPLFTTEIIPLAHVPPEEVLKVIEFLLSPHGKAHAVPSSKSLVVMDYPDRIELIKKRIKDLDLAAAKVDAAAEVSAIDSEATSPVGTRARSIVNMLLGSGDNSGASPSGPALESPEGTSGAERGPPASTEQSATPPTGEIPAPRTADASPSDRGTNAANSAATQIDTGPVLDVVFFTPQYIRAPAITEALSRLVSEYGQISVIAEENRIVAIDQPEYLRRITAAVERLDVPRAQVRIAAMIYDCSLEDVERLGINWTHSVHGSNLTADGVAQDQFSLNSLTFVPPGPNAMNGAMTLSSLGRHFDVTNVVHALNQSSSSKLLADPTVVVLDQESAKIAIVTEIPYQQLTESAMGGSIGTTAFREAGVTLEVTPRIARDGTINLIVTPQFSVLTGFTENDNQPIIARREANTTVRVCDGQTLVIGGLRQKSAVRDRSGIPYLSDLKVIGHLFRYRSDELRESELLVFITPAIIAPQAFGTIREQQAYENSECQLHGVRQCLECCNQMKDKAIYTNQDFGYGSVIYEVPHPSAIPNGTVPPAEVPPAPANDAVAPEQVTSGPRAHMISHPRTVANSGTSSRRESQPTGTVTRAPQLQLDQQAPAPSAVPPARRAPPARPQQFRSAPAATSPPARPQVADLPPPVATPVSRPTRVSMTDMVPPVAAPTVRGPVIDLTDEADAPAPQAVREANAIVPAQAPRAAVAAPSQPVVEPAPTAPDRTRFGNGKPAAIPRTARRSSATARRAPAAAPQEGAPANQTEPPKNSLRSFFRL